MDGLAAQAQSNAAERARMAVLAERQASKRTDLARAAQRPFVAAGPLPVSAEEPTFAEEEGEELEVPAIEAQRAAVFAERVQRKTAQRARAAITAEAERKGAAEAREAVERTVKAGLRRGFQYIVELIAGAFDVGTSGITTIVNIFVHIINFSWLNVEMVYGSYMAKGESKVISPLTWDPLPVPLSPVILHVLLVAADLLLIIAFAALLSFAVLLLATAVVFVTDPAGSTMALARGIGEFGMFADIIVPWFRP